jgi:radical SAM protein with 4Fe4S-binding SPASM domain
VVCGTNQLHEYLFLDWDGAVLPCCFDFSKSMVLGNISSQSLTEIFAGRPWRDMYETFRHQKWSRKAACSRCRADHDPTVRQMAQSIAAAVKPAATVYNPAAFAAGRAVRRESNGTLAVSRDSTGCVVYGPYVRLPAGRYRLYPKLSVGADSVFPANVFVDVCVGKVKQIAMREAAVTGAGPIETSLEFNLSQPDSRELIEFRVWTYGGLVAAFDGATLLRLEDERSGEVAPPLQNLIPASAFLSAAAGSRDVDGSLTFAPGGIAGCAIYGPYANLSSGRYQAKPKIEVGKGGVFPAHLLIDVCAGPTKQLASADVEVESTGEIDVCLEFDISTADEDKPVEFRIWTYGEVGFTFRGVDLVRLPNRMPSGGLASDDRAVSVTRSRRRGIFGWHRRKVG